ncbi:hypothetical protein ElyMa_004180000 [Elysia marginata]|uniref:Uncharacterized protein n=1 Tax=Elysia marginata TaxID=1093978 RepID=A0AAV4GMN7_9GAST|nr:hypothetical protein ElyMa_004180000 [Elysia marginata]
MFSGDRGSLIIRMSSICLTPVSSAIRTGQTLEALQTGIISACLSCLVNSMRGNWRRCWYLQVLEAMRVILYELFSQPEREPLILVDIGSQRGFSGCHQPH